MNSLQLKQNQTKKNPKKVLSTNLRITYQRTPRRRAGHNAITITPLTVALLTPVLPLTLSQQALATGLTSLDEGWDGEEGHDEAEAGVHSQEDLVEGAGLGVGVVQAHEHQRPHSDREQQQGDQAQSCVPHPVILNARRPGGRPVSQSDSQNKVTRETVSQSDPQIQCQYVHCRRHYQYLVISKVQFTSWCFFKHNCFWLVQTVWGVIGYLRSSSFTKTHFVGLSFRATKTGFKYLKNSLTSDVMIPKAVHLNTLISKRNTDFPSSTYTDWYSKGLTTYSFHCWCPHWSSNLQ